MSNETFKIRDRRKKGWFYLDNDYLNGYAKIVGAIATAVYVSLCRHSNSNQKCFPSQELIGKELGINPKTVGKELKKLEECRIIEITKERKSDGRWLSNTYWLLDKTEWKKNDHGTQSPMDHRTLDTDSHRTQSPTKNTKEDKKTNDSNPDEISSLIYEFKDVNPSYEKWFGNRTQRSAAERLLKLYGMDQLKKVIEILPKTNKTPFMPHIATIDQLENKWSSLEDALLKKKKETTTRIII